MLVSYLFVLALVSSKSHASLLRRGTKNETLQQAVEDLDDTVSNASLLRGGTTHNETLREAAEDLDDGTFFDCFPYLLDGHAEPGTDIEHEWSCEFEGSETEPVHTFSFEGDFESTMRERFGDDILDIGGVLKLIVPRSAVNEDSSSIMIDHEGIDVSHDRRERHLASLRGTQQVLIIRVTDNRGHSPSHDANDLRRVFYQDSSNLKNRLDACSAGQLKIVPASATGQSASLLEHGVITINLSVDVSNINESWRTIGDKALTKLSQINNLSYSTRIIILPNAVNFGGAAAWAQVGGNTMWVKDHYASYPIVQVHEYGHLLGQRHSGKNGVGYGDDSCYMGNKVPWNDHGAVMCFNAAKTYYFGWFSQYHREVNPSSSPFNGNLVGIDDASKGRAGSGKVILKFTSNGKHYFVMFNRKKGINREAIGGPNRVMITEQNARNYDSTHKAALSPGQQTSIGNVVVKFCHVNYGSNGDFAKVLVYGPGKTQQCGAAPPGNGNGGGNGSGNGGGNGGGGGGGGTCQNISGWKDNYGKSCGWYTQQRCSLFGNDKGTNNKTAKQACCKCGGGSIGSGGGSGNGSGGGNGNNNRGGNGGGNGNGSCTENKTWHDSGGPKYNCAWYKANPNACSLFGDKYQNNGKTAKQACCACKRR